MGDWYVFWVLAPVSVGSAVAMILARNAVHSALLLIVNLFTLAVFFLILGSPFLFVVQIIVYAGAIMVLFLFVIMLLGVDRTEPLVERIKGQRLLAVLLGFGMAAEVFFAARLGLGLSRGDVPDLSVLNGGQDNVRALARVLFGPLFFPFEVTSVLLIIAAIGAMLHGGRRVSEEETIDVDVDRLPTAGGGTEGGDAASGVETPPPPPEKVPTP